MIDLEGLLIRAGEKLASDVHMTVGLPPVLRIDGALVDDGIPALTEEDVYGCAKELCTDKQLRELKEEGEVDFAVTAPNHIRIRCNIYRQQGNTAIALRLLPEEIPTCQQLELPDILVEQAEKPRGLVLVTGPTGSGKSSTLAALINHINHTRRRHVITLEAPIEYIHRRVMCVIDQREVGTDTKSFAAGLRAALRQDPDVILVGEMRDLETISTAITAAETGHLVFGTLHTKGAANTIDRIIDVFPAEQQEQVRIQLADVIECAVGQTLLPKIGGGQVAVFEVMTVNPAVQNLIRDGRTHQIDNAIFGGTGQGMISMDNELQRLYRAGVISKDVAITYAVSPETLSKRL